MTRANHTCFALLILLSSTAIGEITLEEAKKQDGTIESGTYRAVYLGRLFGTKDTSQIGQITGMYGSATIRAATNVALYGGDGSLGFNSLISQGKMIDTGLRFSNTNQTSVQTIFLPGAPFNTSPFSLDSVAGTALGDSLRNKGSMDFWLATTDQTSTFTAPSNVAGSDKNFYIQFRGIAVPEPASWLLGCTAAGMGWFRFRRKSMA